jgi:uncharacterized membrane protein (UPF0127 family)
MARRWLATFVLIVIVIVAAAVVAQTKSCQDMTVTLPDHTTIHAEIADTFLKRTKGLSNRDSLATNAGMLFLFPSSDTYSFWMKDTRIPLDIIWLNNHIVVDMVTLEPESGETIPQYTPTHAADAVLEINKSEAAAHNLKAGDHVTWPACHIK